MSDRDEARQDFLKAAGWEKAAAAPLAGDASTRSYQRLNLDGRPARCAFLRPLAVPVLFGTRFVRYPFCSAPAVVSSAERVLFFPSPEFEREKKIAEVRGY